jgi:Serine dehydrogenase proteinase
LGLPVTTDMPDDALEMMSLYLQPVRQSRGGVEYRPVPRQKEVGRSLPAKGDAD